MSTLLHLFMVVGTFTSYRWGHWGSEKLTNMSEVSVILGVYPFDIGNVLQLPICS